MAENRKGLLACLLALSMGAAAVTGCGKNVGHGGVDSGKALMKAEVIAQAEYPLEPVYKNEDERYEARRSRKVPERFEEAYGSFAFRTASEVLGKDSQVNTAYSPLGFYYALAMSAQGAAGQTRQELLALLGYPETEEPDGSGTEPGALARDCQIAFQALYHVPNPANIKKDEWGELPSEALYNLRIANSLWADHALNLKQEFADQAARYFYSDIFRADLKEPETAGAMADWVKERTGGMIVPGPEPVPEGELLSLRNTVSYYDEWIDRFNKDKTEADVFTTAEGTQVTCDFMNRVMDSHGFRRGENFTSSVLSLKNGSMEFVLPDEGVDVRELVKSPEILKEVLEGTDGQGMGEVVWKVPKFSYGSSMKLSGNLERLGVQKAFGGDADFSRISDDKPLGISGVSQDVHIAIDENGVEAAAFTEIAYAGAAIPKGRADMVLDRPFLYAIRSQGQILFVGICGNPKLQAAKEEEPQSQADTDGKAGRTGTKAEPEKPEVQGRTGADGSRRAAAAARDFLDARNPYIGNASADGKLVSLIWDYYGLKPGWSMELQTTEPPYGMTLHLEQELDNITMQKVAGLLIGLIDNCYSVSWDYPRDGQGNREYFYMPASAFRQYGDIAFIKEYVREDEQLEKVEELLETLEEADRPLRPRTRAKTLEQAVAAAVLEYNRYSYSQDWEVSGEGHKLLGQEETDTMTSVYALTMYGTYRFQDGNFVKDGGCGVIPMVFQMAREPDGAYVAVRCQRPEDGGGYIESIRRLFPERLWESCLSPSEEVRDDLKKQERAYAEDYLKQIGREAAVGDYGDFPHMILTDVGVPVEVSNAMGDTRNFAPDDPARLAPFWLGNIERLEEGERFIYEQSYDADKKEIRFSKIRYESGETVAQSVYDGISGEKKE